jgi:hypothetical protein
VSKCEGFAGKIYGHDFKEAVCLEDIGTIPKEIADTDSYTVDTDDMMNASKLKRRTVVAIYCRRCGETIEVKNNKSL